MENSDQPRDNTHPYYISWNLVWNCQTLNQQHVIAWPCNGCLTWYITANWALAFWAATLGFLHFILLLMFRIGLLSRQFQGLVWVSPSKWGPVVWGVCGPFLQHGHQFIILADCKLSQLCWQPRTHTCTCNTMSERGKMSLSLRR